MASPLSAELEPKGGLSLFLDIAHRSIPFAVGMCYLVGLIVTNIHLRSYKADFLGFFSLQYFAAGIWAAYPIVAGAVIRLILFGPLKWSESQHRVLRWVSNAAFVVVLVFFVVSIVGAALILVEVAIDGVGAAAGWLVSFVFGVWVSNPKAWRDEKAKPGSADKYANILMPAFLGLIGLLGLGFYCLLFAPAYGSIPSRWAGGEPVAVYFVPTPELNTLLTDRFGFEADSIGLRGRLLLMTGSDALMLPDSGHTAILIKRSDLLVLEQREEPTREAPLEP